MEWQVGLLIAGSAAVAALAANWVIVGQRPVRVVKWTPLDEMDERTVFLFEDEDLVDATPEAHAMLRAAPEQFQGWPRLRALLEPRFQGADEAMSQIKDTQTMTLPANDGSALLLIEWRGGLTRVVLTEPEDTRQTEDLDGIGLRALSDELATLRGAVDFAPILVWRENVSGVVEWANAAYFELARQLKENNDEVAWPLPKLFPLQLADGGFTSERRMSLKLPGAEAPLWFEMRSETLGEATMVHAVPIDRLVRTEANLREFLQTLTKTFAHLPTGLAVFDRSRRLALFNPALTDLSALEPQFLSARPTLYEFLDKLRERQRMPEPKDYKSWRRQISEMEAAAATGTHQETWSLPTGQTFRVTGRPHPEGAVAFLFEDISAEVTATRRFRAELELNQAVLDSLDQAVAVFSSAGTLIQSNTAYARIWNTEADRTLSEVSLLEALRHWTDHCVPSPDWATLRDHAVRTHRRARWSGKFTRHDGLDLWCEFAPLQGNACRITFGLADMPATAPETPHPGYSPTAAE